MVGKACMHYTVFITSLCCLYLYVDITFIFSGWGLIPLLIFVSIHFPSVICFIPNIVIWKKHCYMFAVQNAHEQSYTEYDTLSKYVLNKIKYFFFFFTTAPLISSLRKNWLLWKIYNRNVRRRSPPVVLTTTGLGCDYAATRDRGVVRAIIIEIVPPCDAVRAFVSVRNGSRALAVRLVDVPACSARQSDALHIGASIASRV